MTFYLPFIAPFWERGVSRIFNWCAIGSFGNMRTYKFHREGGRDQPVYERVENKKSPRRQEGAAHQTEIDTLGWDKLTRLWVTKCVLFTKDVAVVCC